MPIQHTKGCLNYTIFIFLLVGPAILLGRFLLQGKVLYWGLPLLQFIPWQVTAFEQIQAGILPLWNPLSGMGSPLLANYQTALFYPTTWLLYFFHLAGGTPWLAWGNTLVGLIHMLWAGIGTALLLRRWGYGQLNQVTAGITYSLSSFFVARTGFSTEIWVSAWLPWLIFTLSRQKMLPLVVVLSLQFLAGHAQLTWYTLLLAAGWSFYWGWKGTRLSGAVHRLTWLAAGVLIASVLTACQLLPTLEYLEQSQRSRQVNFETAMAYSFSPYHLISFLLPDFWGNPGLGNYQGNTNYWENAIYIGIMPLILAAGSIPGLFSRRKNHQKENSSSKPSTPGWSGYIRGKISHFTHPWAGGDYQVGRNDSKEINLFFWSAIGTGLVFAMGWFTPVFPFLFEHIPTFDLFHGPARFLIWVTFGLSVLGGIGVENWRALTGRGLYWLRLGTAAAGALAPAMYLSAVFFVDIRPGLADGVLRTAVWGVAGSVLWLILSSNQGAGCKAYINYGLLGIIATDLLTAGWHLNPVVNMNAFSKPTEATVPVQPYGTTGRLYIAPEDEYELKYQQLFRFDDFGPPERLSITRSVILPNTHLGMSLASANNFDPLLPARYSVWMEFVGRISSDERKAWLEMMDVGWVEKLNIERGLQIAFNPIKNTGRFRWYECAAFVENGEQAWKKLQDRTRAGISGPVILEGKHVPGRELKNCEINFSPKITIIQNMPDSILIEMTADQPGYLLMADTWFPGWEGLVDGRSTFLYRADYLFRALEIPAGIHQVEQRYRPASFRFGSVISLTGWMSMVIILLLRYRQKRKNRHENCRDSTSS